MGKTLQLLRNSELYSSKELALSGLETKLSSASDGEMIIARYTNDDSEVETLLGIAYNGDNGTYYTIFDAEERESSIAENTVSSSDSTINVTVTESEGIDLSVNIDNETIINTGGTLSVASSALTQYIGENAINISEADNDNNKTISLVISDSDNVLSQSEDGLIANITVEKVTDGLSENVKEAYNILGKDGTELGTIPVYKDSSLYSVTLGTTNDTVDSSTGVVTSGDGDDALVFVYYLADGTYSLVAIDVSDFLRESEFGNGLQVNNGIVSVLVDSNSETYLSVSEDGVKLDGIDNAINNAIDELDLTSVGGSGYMITTVSQTDGQVAATAVTASAENISATATSATDTAIAVNGTTVEEQISSLATSIQTVADTAIEPVAGNGINVSTSGTEATITAVAVNDDPIIEVTEDGIGTKDDAIFDCGSY